MISFRWANLTARLLNRKQDHAKIFLVDYLHVVPNKKGKEKGVEENMGKSREKEAK